MAICIYWFYIHTYLCVCKYKLQDFGEKIGICTKKKTFWRFRLLLTVCLEGDKYIVCRKQTTDKIERKRTFYTLYTHVIN